MEFQEPNLLKSMQINSLIPNNSNKNNYNSLQFISTPNLIDLKNKNKFNNNLNDSKNNGQSNNFLNISENELFNFELDQSTESIINKSLSQQIPFDYSTSKNNIDNINNNIMNSSGLNLKNNNKMLNSIDIGEYNHMNNLEEKLNQEYLKNNELQNYIEILKQTINNTLIKNSSINIEGLDSASETLKKNKIDILTEYTTLKLENEKIKKQLVMQQILYSDMKNEIINLKQENSNMKTSLDKNIKENKNLLKIKEELSNNYNILLNESDLIKNTLSKYEEEFTKCQQNNNDYIRLKTENNDLNNNIEKQKNILLNLQNDFNKINKSNNELSKYNEKLVKENQQIKRELFHKKNELDNVNNKMNINLNDIKENNELLIKEKQEFMNNIKNLQDKNEQLNEIKENQKIEIESLNQIIKNKNDEILKYLKEIEYLKNNNIYNNIKNNNEKMSSDINLDLIINNVKNELKEKNKLIEDLKSQNINLIKENDYKENKINEYIKKENSSKKELNNLNSEDKKYREQIDKLNTFIKQKELEIYSFKNNEKSYNKIVDLSYQSIKQFIIKLKNYEEFKLKNDDDMYINVDLNDKNNSENDLFIRPLKEFVNKMNEENISNYNEINTPLIEKIKKINIFTNIIPFQINVLYNKLKTLQQENQVLLKIKSKTNNFNNNEDMNNNNNNLSINLNYNKNKDINDDLNNITKYGSNTNLIIPMTYQKNIQNIKTINGTRNNIIDINTNPSANISINFKNIFDDEKNKNLYRTNSNSLNKKLNQNQDKEININNNQKLDKINLKVKEINNYIFNQEAPKTIFNEEEINYSDNILNSKTTKKSKITLFKEEISNKSFMNANNNNKKNKENKNIFLSIQTSPENKNRNIGYKINKKSSKNNISNLSQLVFKNNSNINNNNNNSYLIPNKTISQPVTNRSNQNIKSNLASNNNTKKDALHNRNNKKILEELNISYTSKNFLSTHTIDSSRLNNNANKKNNELYQKSINGLADEVMKPSFLKSDVSMSMLGTNLNNNINDNNNGNESFLFLTKNKLKKRNKNNESYSFIEIRSNLKRNVSPFNKGQNDRNGNNNNLSKNRSFLY